MPFYSTKIRPVYNTISNLNELYLSVKRERYPSCLVLGPWESEGIFPVWATMDCSKWWQKELFLAGNIMVKFHFTRSKLTEKQFLQNINTKISIFNIRTGIMLPWTPLPTPVVGDISCFQHESTTVLRIEFNEETEAIQEIQEIPEKDENLKVYQTWQQLKIHFDLY